MPCRDYMEEQYISSEDNSEKLDLANIEIAELTGMLCALCNVVVSTCDPYQNALDIFQRATKDGECDDIQYWYEKHTGQDKERLRKKLSDFSIDEIKLIAEMVERDEI